MNFAGRNTNICTKLRQAPALFALLGGNGCKMSILSYKMSIIFNNRFSDKG